MRLLIITQVVDTTHPILGFFHRWIEEFAGKCESVLVICLYEGVHALPGNVRVLSLGKEAGVSRLSYLRRFFRYIRTEKNNYDSVFVHMNQIYVILGGLFWRAWGKRVGLWYNHPNGGVSQWLGFLLAHRVFHTSPFAFSANRKKSHRMPAGIDTNLFKKTDTAASRRDALSVGRIDASKNLDVLVDALLILHERGTPATATIIGVPSDPAYLSALKERARPLGEHIVFAGPIPNERLSEQFSAHTCSVNLAASGHYDKTVLESCACETPVLVSSRAFSGFLPETLTFSERDAHSLADRLSAVLSWSPAMIEDTGRALRQHVVEHESLSKLVESVLISLRQHDRV